jgi:small nuclear ribonucleoprotein (snRNP)-like protein
VPFFGLKALSTWTENPRWSSFAYHGFRQETVRCAFRNLNAHIVVVLKDGFEYRGKIVGCDNLVNVVLEEAVEYFGRLQRGVTDHSA